MHRGKGLQKFGGCGDMNHKEMWEASGLTGTYEAWQFGGNPDGLAELVRQGIKTATSSAYYWYEHGAEKEPLPREGEYSVILNSKNEAVCIIQTQKVSIVPFRDVSAEHAYKEGEENRSLESWRKIHRDFFAKELSAEGVAFDTNMLVVCEEFIVVYP